MAKLKIQAPDGKSLLIDVTGHDQSEYDDLATAAVDDYMSKKGPKSIAEQNLADLDGQGPLDELKDMGGVAWDTIKDVGTLTKAGYSGVADLIAGNGLDKSVENIAHVKKGEDPTSAAGTFGEAFGAQFTPVQIALQAAFGKAAEAIAPWVTKVMQGWSEAAARMAIGTTKKIASAIGIQDLSAVAKFLLTPITIGGKAFEPIITATSSPEDMLTAANAIKMAAGKQLGAVSQAADKAIKASVDKAIAGGSLAESPVAIDLAGLKTSLEALKGKVAEVAPNLGKAVVNQYEAAIADVDGLIKNSLEGESDKVFSTLSRLKTTIGDLTYRHGSPLESKAALNDVYHAISKTLDDAAGKVGGATGEEYAAANAIYNKISTIVEALEGKVISGASKSFFNDPAALVAGLTTGMASGPLGLITGPATFMATKAAENYGPQAIAQGLSKGAPLVAGAIKIGARGIPVVGNAIAQALQSDEQ